MGAEALDGSFLLFCVPPLESQGVGVPGNWDWEGKGYPNADSKTKGHCILAGPVAPRTQKDLKIGVQGGLNVGKLVKNTT